MNDLGQNAVAAVRLADHLGLSPGTYMLIPVYVYITGKYVYVYTDRYIHVSKS